MVSVKCKHKTELELIIICCSQIFCDVLINRNLNSWHQIPKARRTGGRQGLGFVEGNILGHFSKLFRVVPGKRQLLDNRENDTSKAGNASFQVFFSFF